MIPIPLTKVEQNINELMNQTIKYHNRFIIKQEDSRSIEETLYLNSIPGLAQSIKKSMEAPRSEFIDEDELEW